MIGKNIMAIDVWEECKIFTMKKSTDILKWKAFFIGLIVVLYVCFAPTTKEDTIYLWMPALWV